MRLSCNGCRVLRKGCGDDCVLKPCLSWIRNPESQGHATLFLAKFYGRAGLLNLLSSGPPHLRPAICRSLLYESCGRIINPIFGSVGLLWSGRWHLCQAAVEAVLKGIPITQIPSDTNTDSSVLSDHFKTSGDIRHINKEMAAKLHNIPRANRGRFKREGRRRPKSMEYCFVVDKNHHHVDLAQRKVPSSPEVIEIVGSPEHEESMMDREEHEWVETSAALDLNSEQLPNRVCNTDHLYKIDLNL